MSRFFDEIFCICISRRGDLVVSEDENINVKLEKIPAQKLVVFDQDGTLKQMLL